VRGARWWCRARSPARYEVEPLERRVQLSDVYFNGINNIGKVVGDTGTPVVAAPAGAVDGVAFDGAGTMYYGLIQSRRISLYKRDTGGNTTNLGEVVDATAAINDQHIWSFGLTAGPDGIYFTRPQRLKFEYLPQPDGSFVTVVTELSPTGVAKVDASGNVSTVMTLPGRQLAGIAFDGAGQMYYASARGYTPGTYPDELVYPSDQITVYKWGSSFSEPVNAAGASSMWNLSLTSGPDGIYFTRPQVTDRQDVRLPDGSISTTITEASPASVARVDADGNVSTVASAPASILAGVAFDAAGNLYYGKAPGDAPGTYLDNVPDRPRTIALYRNGTSLGQVVNWTSGYTSFWSFELTRNPHRPILILPGIGGSFIDPAFSGWATHRALHPTRLKIDPILSGYEDLIRSLQNAGYTVGRDLFAAPYDWRMPSGPRDGVFDGHVGGLTATSITDGRFEYGVDYLGYWLQEAAEQYRLFTGDELDQVDVVAHSTGGIVARTYVQSDAYGGTFADPIYGSMHLPRVRNLMLVGVPERGASKALNPLLDNFSLDLSFKYGMSKLIYLAYRKVLHGKTVTGPDHDINLASISTDGTAATADPARFIRQFVPTIDDLLATYKFVDDGSGPLKDLNADPALANGLMLDLNAGLDGGAQPPAGSPNAFADRVGKATVIYGTGLSTPTLVRAHVGPVAGARSVFHIPDMLLGTVPGANETWYEDVQLSAGDGTVPVLSSAGQFFGDARFDLHAFPGASHLGLMYDASVQKLILSRLGIALPDGQVSTTLARKTFPHLVTVFDPVDAVLVDAQGRRLGHTAAEGNLSEIPESVYVGDADGVGWIFGALGGKYTLRLTGLGTDYYVQVAAAGAGSGGYESGGFLAQGGVVTTDVAIRPEVTSATFAFTGPGQSVDVTFSHDVSGSLSAGDLQLTNLTTGQVVPAAAIAVAFDATTNTARFTFPGYAYGSLPDGDYRATLLAAGVTDVSGNALVNDYSLQFFVLAGDANHDRTVDFNDLVRLAQNYNTTGGKTWADGDFTGDGNVDFNDLVILAQRYNTTLPPTPAASPAPAPVASASVAKEKPKPVFSTTPVAKAKPAPAKPKAVARPRGR
jgi:hypothetical protein